MTLALPLSMFPQLRLQGWSSFGWERGKHVGPGNLCLGLGLESLWGTLKPRYSNVCFQRLDLTAASIFLWAMLRNPEGAGTAKYTYVLKLSNACKG